MKEANFWLSYQDLHDKNPKSDSEAKVNFYNQNSEFIIRSSKNPNPELAVIIPAYNESALIARTLASINHSIKLQDNVNVFIVDNASTDDTSEIAQTFGARVIKESKKGIGQARQTGLEAIPSSVKYVLTTDADTVVPLNWFQEHQKSLENKNTVYTYGEVNFISDKTLLFADKILLFEYTKIANFLHTIKNKFGIVIGGGSNSGYKKDIALYCGGYNRNLERGEDTELMTKISIHGDVIKIDSSVMTSARRIINEGIVCHGIERLKDNLLHCIGIKKIYSEEYKDYRESDNI